jgi:hypothetical protein
VKSLKRVPIVRREFAFQESVSPAVKSFWYRLQECAEIGKMLKILANDTVGQVTRPVAAVSIGGAPSFDFLPKILPACNIHIDEITE